MKNYYTYAYLREDDTPYYIGKGTGKRAWDKNHRVNLPTDPSRIQIIKEGLTDEEAKSLEIELIAKYGRKDLGTGILQNQTDGGDGTRLEGEKNGMYGRTHSEEAKSKIKAARASQKIVMSEETKQKMRDRQKEAGGWFKGRKHSEESKQKNRLSNLGREGSKKLVGIPKSEEHKKKISESRINGKKQEPKQCPHCNTMTSPGNYVRWHGDNCKSALRR